MTSPIRVPRATPRSLPAARPTTRRPDLHVVGEPRRRSRAGLVVAASTVVVFAALLAGAIAHSLLVTGQVHLDKVGVDARAERQQLQLERLRLATYQSPARITAEAKRIGMVPALEQNWVSPGTGAAPTVTSVTSDTTTPADPPADPPAVDKGELATGTTGETVGEP